MYETGFNLTKRNNECMVLEEEKKRTERISSKERIQRKGRHSECIWYVWYSQNLAKIENVENSTFLHMRSALMCRIWKGYFTTPYRYVVRFQASIHKGYRFIDNFKYIWSAHKQCILLISRVIYKSQIWGHIFHS